VPFLKQQKMVGGVGTVYVCENYTCKLPTSDSDKLKSIVTAMATPQAMQNKAPTETPAAPTPAPKQLPAP